MIDRQSGVPIALGLRTPLTSLIQTLAVAEHLSFCRAANALAVSQSSVSARNKALEEEPGIVLFERNAGGVRFTEAGRLFVERVSAGVDHLDHAAKSARMAALGECGRLRIGVHGLIPRSFLANLLGRYRGTYPGPKSPKTLAYKLRAYFMSNDIRRLKIRRTFELIVTTGTIRILLHRHNYLIINK
jgi:DNA-binding transcriptional LysR family regulator